MIGESVFCEDEQTWILRGIIDYRMLHLSHLLLTGKDKHDLKEKHLSEIIFAAGYLMHLATPR